jgi:Polymerase beta, Nucleotidyltransferase
VECPAACSNISLPFDSKKRLTGFFCGSFFCPWHAGTDCVTVKKITMKDAMINQAIIEEVKNRLIKTYNPIAIYLFGSHAWGKPDEESDLDLLIVVEDFKKD